MTSTNFIHNYCNAKQLKLPLLLEYSIPFNSEVRTFDEVFGRLDIRKYLVIPKDSRGRIGYNPVNMLKLVMFCQMINITSLRAMAKAAQHDIRIMWLTDCLQPSHNTIKEFINKYMLNSIDKIFQKLNDFIITEEKIDINTVFIDGTKIEANANKYKFVWKGSIEKFQDKLFIKISRILRKLNDEYVSYNISFPTYDSYDESYLSEIKSFLHNEINKYNITFVYGKGTRKTPLQRFYEAIDEYIRKLVEYKYWIETIGSERNSCARTDVDATFMHMKEDHMRNGQLKAGYNVQIAVSNEYIVHLDIFQNRSDYKTFIPFLDGFKETYGFFPKFPIADAGYGGLANYRFLKGNNVELFQKYSMFSKDTKDKKHINDIYRPINFERDLSGNYYYPGGEKLEFLYKNKQGNDVYLVPSIGKKVQMNLELWKYQKEARENLKSELGIELRTQRSIQVEGAFGVIKEAYKFRRFKRRGTEFVKLEFYLIAVGYNLAKFHNKLYRITH